MGAPQDSDRPLACDLAVLDPETRAAHLALAADLLGSATATREELPDGYAFQFPSAAYAQVVAFVANERRCCPFIRFVLDVPPYDEPITLRLTGGPGVKDVLAAELGI
jgi:hypothetical protein